MPGSLVLLSFSDASAVPGTITVNYSDGSTYNLVNGSDYTYTYYGAHILYYKGSYTTTNSYNLSLIEFSFVPTKAVSFIKVKNKNSSTSSYVGQSNRGASYCH